MNEFGFEFVGWWEFFFFGLSIEWLVGERVRELLLLLKDFYLEGLTYRYGFVSDVVSISSLRGFGTLFSSLEIKRPLPDLL